MHSNVTKGQTPFLPCCVTHFDALYIDNTLEENTSYLVDNLWGLANLYIFRLSMRVGNLIIISILLTKYTQFVDFCKETLSKANQRYILFLLNLLSNMHQSPTYKLYYQHFGKGYSIKQYLWRLLNRFQLCFRSFNGVHLKREEVNLCVLHKLVEVDFSFHLCPMGSLTRGHQ